MADSIHVKLPDGSVKDVPKGTTPLEVAKSISPRLADAALVAQISSNGDQAGEGARPTLIDLAKISAC
jgi:threonyl-tRNA synthetase